MNWISIFESVIFVFLHRITMYAAGEHLPRRLVTSAMSTGETEFLDLLEQHKTILFKIANLYCRNRADFADVVQEITFQAGGHSTVTTVPGLSRRGCTGSG
jgi:hypothetical protein